MDSIQQADLDISPQLPILRAQLARLGLRWLGRLSYNASETALFEASIAKGEAMSSTTGALVTETGLHTGRSPKDKFIVLDDMTAATVWWNNNQAMNPRHFEILKADMMIHARLKELCVQDLEACADPANTLSIRVVTELTWHALFIRHLLKPSTKAENFQPGLTIINLPSFKANPQRHGTNSETVIAFDLTQNLVLIAGTQYAGEIKKAVFTVLNYKLPEAGVLPMHCSANTDENNNTAIFFGLSGTGKTTLSADPHRILIGDDEHGWGNNGVFNIENGCYAKVINLSPEAEPEIYAASQRATTVLENVGLNEDQRTVDFNDISRTENTRAAYPLQAISNASATRQAGHPKTIVMLTADAFGVLPPVAKLNPDEAVQQFLAGYTAKLAGTERGVKTPEATFSACFGAPFLPRHPQVYANMLKDLMAKHNVSCFLVNTGWTGGAFGTGTRIKLATTRNILRAILSGELNTAATRRDDVFGLSVPVHVQGVEDALLDPRQNWSDQQAYDVAAKALAQRFSDVAAKFVPPLDSKRIAAE
jgi:phosphoenolpyruvate carboxykinase (ATP)